jgi:hypothetical protein
VKPADKPRAKHYIPGSQGEAVDKARSDRAFREQVKAFAQFRGDLHRELSQAETGHHEMRFAGSRESAVRCVHTERLAQPEWKHHPGYLSAWFTLRSFLVELQFLGQDVAGLKSVEALTHYTSNGVQGSVDRLSDRGWAHDDINNLGLTWSARNPLFWYALALVHETPHPMLCGECRRARIGGDGKPCGCADGSGRVYMHCTATVAP